MLEDGHFDDPKLKSKLDLSSEKKTSIVAPVILDKKGLCHVYVQITKLVIYK